MSALIKFYNMVPSPPCRAALLTARAIGLPLDITVFSFEGEKYREPEFVKLNPQHCVPTIVDGDFVLAESRAICAYFVSKYSDGSLYPTDLQERANIDRMLQFDLGSIYYRYSDYAYKVFEGETELFPDRLERLHEVLGILNTMLEGHTYAVGNKITIADHSLASTLSTIEETGIDISNHKIVFKYLRHLEATLPGYEELNAVGARECGEIIKKQFPK